MSFHVRTDNGEKQALISCVVHFSLAFHNKFFNEVILKLLRSSVDQFGRLYFGGAPKSLQMVNVAMKLKDANSLKGNL